MPIEFLPGSKALIHIPFDGRLFAGNSSITTVEVKLYAAVSRAGSPQTIREFSSSLPGDFRDELVAPLSNVTAEEFNFVPDFFNESIGIQLELSLRILAQASESSSARADFSNTMYIASFEFLDPQGNFIPGITVVDDLGVEYPVNVVPEPSALALVVGGSLVARFRRQKIRALHCAAP
jgi:hypothetical protein